MELEKTRYFIEGNISSGKSTLLARLEKKFGKVFHYVPENLQVWRSYRGINPLEIFYSDPVKFGLTFQIFVSVERLIQAVTPLKTTSFFERGLGATKNVFSQALLDLNPQISKFEAVTMERYFSALEGIRQPVGETTRYIYLRCNPAVCQQRIAERGRSEEQAISLEYLETLHSYHELWLGNRSDTLIFNTERDDWIAGSDVCDFFERLTLEAGFAGGFARISSKSTLAGSDSEEDRAPLDYTVDALVASEEKIDLPEYTFLPILEDE